MNVELVTIDLFGPLKVTLPDGSDATPRSAKARGLIALVAEASSMSRSRRWLEDKLWSTRSPAQASGSLRQTLTEIRKSFGDYNHALTATRLDVIFHKEYIKSNINNDSMSAVHEREFLEGIDVKDQEFEAWLIAARMRYEQFPIAAPVSIRPGKIKLNCTSSTDGGMTGALGQALSNRIGNSIAEQVNARCHLSKLGGGVDVDLGDIEINCHIVEDGILSVAFLRIFHVESGSILYSRECKMRQTAVALISSDLIKEATFSAAESVLANLPVVVNSDLPEIRATTFAQLGMKGLFSFDPAKLEEADRNFEQAFNANNNGVYLAWRAMLRTIQDIEQFSTDGQTLREEAKDLTIRALELSCDNPLVNALVAYVRLNLFDDFNSGIDLAQSAIEINPANAFAIQSLSVAHLISGDIQKAFELSGHSRVITRHSRFKHWWQMNFCLVCIANGRFDEAIKAAEVAIQISPLFRPPHRQLIALYSHKGDTGKARALVRKLQGIEDGFSVDRLLHDVDYPSRTLRAAGLLGPSNKGLQDF